MAKKRLDVYTDGACKGNPGPGGWGALIRGAGTDLELFGGEYNTTNNRMELTAVIQALSAIDSCEELTVYTDSKYVLDGISSWLVSWKKNGWKTASKNPVKNVDLWRELDDLVALFQIDWIWVKGHSGNPGNDRADQLANKGIPGL